MRRTTLVVVCFVALAMLALLSATAMAADMLVGTWKLNVAKSKYSPGPPPQSATLKIDPIDGGIKTVGDGVDSQGKKTHNESSAKYDGKDYPSKAMLDGKPNPVAADIVSWKKIDDFTYEVTTKLKGKPLGVTKVVISKDGKTITATTTGTNAQGQKVNNIAVLEKQ
jgi:hypothetical protein